MLDGLMSKENIEIEKKLVLVMLEQLSYIVKYANNAIYYGSTISMIASYLIENLTPHDSEEPCNFESEEIKDIFNSFKDAEIQLKKMHSTVDSISEIHWDFNNTFNDFMLTTGILYIHSDYFEELLLNYKNYCAKQKGDYMMNKKSDQCMLACDKICDYCGDCEKYGLLEIPLDEPSEEEPSEDELLEQLYYELEREADRM